MRFVDIHADQFGILQDTGLSNLSPGMTVVFGSNGSGKTTLVSLLRGILFGYSTEHAAFQPDDSPFGGSVTLESHGRSCRLTRARRGISSDVSMTDLTTGRIIDPPSNELPAWINESIYREIFTVGDQESTRFDLLSRLSLQDNTGGTQAEIRKAELAIDQAVREREGSVTDRGLRQKLSDLKDRRRRLNQQLSGMRSVDPDLSARLSDAEAELRRLQTSLSDVDQQIEHTTSEIRRLQDLRSRLSETNVVALDRRVLEERISRLEVRRKRWAEIRQSIQGELAELQSPQQHAHCQTSLTSLRALVARLEERMLAAQKADSSTAGPTHRIDLLQQEIFALCEHLKLHEDAVSAHESSIEKMTARQSLLDAENMETILECRILALREEIARSANVLADAAGTIECRSEAHRTHVHTHGCDGAQLGDVERQLAAMQRRRDELTTRSSELSLEAERLNREVFDLNSQLRKSARLEDIDHIKADLADIDAQIEVSQERWDVLERTENHLRTVIDQLHSRHDSNVLELASQYIDRLTDGECYRLRADSPESQILAETRQSSHPVRLNQLSRGTRDQVALCLRLALIQCRAQQTERCPLILDEVFIISDDNRASSVADLLMEIADQGQQIIFLTCQNDVRDLFARRNAQIMYLEDQPAVVAESPPVTLAELPPAVPVRSATPVRENTNWLYYLEVDNSVEDLSGLTVAEIEAFRAAGVETIDALLRPSVDELEQTFRSRGYSISRDRIRAWRGQAELATQIPMLRRSDAELLYAAGIHSTVELSRMRPESVYEIVTTFQSSQAGARFRRSGRNIDRQQAINWSRWSQHARSLSEARSSRSRFFVRTTDTDSTKNSSGSQPGPRYRRSRISDGRSSVRRQRRPQLTTEDRRERELRQTMRRQRLARHSSSYRATQSTDESGSGRTLKFYLSRSSDVDAAPSIGPRTAQRLATTAIYTVDDLLNADADAVATKLDNRRIKPETIEQWQAQARLVCQVPELRGHDAQLLVACGVTDPEELSQKRPADLFALIGPFANTSEGERIVRGGQKPDLEEVTDWISLAQQARPLQAAA